VPEEEEAVAGTHETDGLNSRLLQQEGVGSEGHRSTQCVDEVPMGDAIRALAAAVSLTTAIIATVAALYLVVVAVVGVEEALEGLGEFLAAEAIGDEVAPGLGHALEPAEGSGGDAGEDLHDGVVGQQGHRGRAPPGAVHAAASEKEVLEVRG